MDWADDERDFFRIHDQFLSDMRREEYEAMERKRKKCREDEEAAIVRPATE